MNLEDRPLFTDDEFLSNVASCNPEYIYFVRNSSEAAEVTIVVEEEGSHRYFVYPWVVHLSSHVGGTGKHQLYIFHSFLKKIFDRNLSASILGRTLPEKEFNSLSNGHDYPGTFLKNKHDRTMNWWDDFIFLYETEQRKLYFIDQYGSSFVEAQDIVRAAGDKSPHL